MSEHTPGPWKYYGEGIPSVTLEAKVANARLIAGAPVMFAALEEIREATWRILSSRPRSARTRAINDAFNAADVALRQIKEVEA